MTIRKHTSEPWTWRGHTSEAEDRAEKKTADKYSRAFLDKRLKRKRSNNRIWVEVLLAKELEVVA